MQFVLLIFVNVIMMAVFYLVISLKLEKKATEFRERRFRREMDEIINDFNLTAERNISLMEKRISLMKILLEKSGHLKGIDIVNRLDDTESFESLMKNSGSHEDRAGEKPDIMSQNTGKGSMNIPAASGGWIHDFMRESRKIMTSIAQRILNSMEGGSQHTADSLQTPGPDRMKKLPTERPGAPVFLETDDQNKYLQDKPANIPLAKDFSRFKDYVDVIETPEKEEPIPRLDEKGITGLFETSEDKYALISELYTQGYSIELIAKSSGIPMGEVKLVLNLNQA